MGTPLIVVEHVDFAYQDTLALEDASLVIQEGDFVGLFGPNGGGKTTLLKLLMGFLSPKKGKISILGRPPQAMGKQIGYVPQHLRFDRDFPISALDVVMLGCLSKLTWWGGYTKESKEKAYQALEKVGVSHKALAPFGTLSGGEAQRVLIARAIVDTPKLLILDEPTSSVDPAAEQSIYNLLVELNKTITIVMVTHDLQTVLDKVKRFLCVHRRVTSFQTKEICEHFALGLYHTPLTSTQHFSF